MDIKTKFDELVVAWKAFNSYAGSANNKVMITFKKVDFFFSQPLKKKLQGGKKNQKELSVRNNFRNPIKK